MKFCATLPLLASFTGLVLACEANVDAVPAPDPVVVVDGGAPSIPAPEEDGGSTLPTTCSNPLADLSCPTLTPAPADKAAIAAFVKDAAIPLRCGAGDDKALWDVRPLVDLYGSQKIFMMGEVHGTNEIGILSSIVFEQLAAKKQVNVLAFEIPMDFGAGLERWVATGNDPEAEQMLEYFAPNMFGSILTRTARELAMKGTPIRVAAVDYPYTTDIPVSELQQIGAKLKTQADKVLATLPVSTDQPPSQADLTKATEYFDHIMASKDAICAELTAADCERLVAMTHALWVATFLEDRGDLDLWFTRREEVIYFNLKAAMKSPTDRMYLHMGAAHTNKYEFSAGSRMVHEYAPTKDQVFSVAPAFGDGSVIWYGGEQDLPGDPLTLTAALTNAPTHPFFVSTTRPSTKCVTNPFGLEPEQRTSSGPRGETYDAYIHYGKLTSERSPSKTTFQRDAAVSGETTRARGAGSVARLAAERYVALRARVEAKEAAVLVARRTRAALRTGN